MPIKILMPALSPTMKEGNLAKWIKQEGDYVESGDVIAEIETDKATMEIEAVDEGRIGKIIVPEGKKNVKVNSLLAVILEDGEERGSIDSLIKENPSPNNEDKAQNNSHAKQTTPQKAETKTEPMGASATKKVFASPLAKNIAKSEDISLVSIKGSGPYGRIVKDDVIKFIEEGSSALKVRRSGSEYNILPISNIRNIIAERLSESKQTIPHFYLSMDCNMDKLLAMRADINILAGDPAKYKISVNDFIIKATAKALLNVPEANSSWSDEGILQYNNVDVAVAVAIDDGLVTPIIQNADQKSLIKISSEMKELAKRAKAGGLAPHEFQGGGFTISNLGMFGITHFNAIVNPPQSCILSVGAGTEKPVVKDGKIEISNIMTMSLSCDHRVVDGAIGANLLKKIKEYLEHPISLIGLR